MTDWNKVHPDDYPLLVGNTREYQVDLTIHVVVELRAESEDRAIEIAEKHVSVCLADENGEEIDWKDFEDYSIMNFDASLRPDESEAMEI